MTRKKPPAPCGTNGGYYQHRVKSKTPPCDACKKAHSEHTSKAKKAKRLGNCACGTKLRTQHAQCSVCRRKAERAAAKDVPKYRESDTPSPVQWVRRGLIWHPVNNRRQVA